MRLTKARVQNYRSIIDSGDFEIENIKTVLVGINEAGKTAILKALHQLNPGSDIEKISFLRDFPRSRYAEYTKGKTEESQKDTPFVTGYFMLEDFDIDNIEVDIPDDINLSTLIYKLDRRYGKQFHSIINFEQVNWADIEKDMLRLIEALRSNETANEIITKLQNKLDSLSSNKNVISFEDSEEMVGLLNNAEVKINEENQKEIDRLEMLLTKVKRNIAYNELLKFFSDKLPKFIYFNNYIRVKPVIHLEQLAYRQEQKMLDDKYYDYGNISLLKYLGYSARELSELGIDHNDKLDIEQFRKLKDERHYRLNAVSMKLTNDIQDVWNPKGEKDKASTLRVFADGQYLKVIVADQLGAEIEIDQRSEGFQWMVSFFIVFESQADGDYKNTILLLDEPATSLHALKQKEFIRTINKLAEKNQTIYTTHSPFMISQDELDFVRIVELIDQNVGTKVNNKIISNDPAALFPLQEALGYNLAQSMFTAKKNILLEGLTDLWYLEGINSLLPIALDNDIAMLPVGSASKFSYYANIFHANDLNCVAILDSDVAGSQAAQQDVLVNALGIKNILQAKDFCEKKIESAEFEDIIRDTLIKIFESSNDLTLNDTDKESSQPVTDIFKKSKSDFSKFKLAKSFLNWARQNTFSELTKSEQENCTKLVKMINQRLE